MKNLFAIAAIVALASSPALAKSAHQTQAPRAAQAMLNDTPAQDGITAAIAADPNAVYVDGRYAGTDPDPTVRLQLRNDFYTTYYGG